MHWLFFSSEVFLALNPVILAPYEGSLLRNTSHGPAVHQAWGTPPLGRCIPVENRRRSLFPTPQPKPGHTEGALQQDSASTASLDGGWLPPGTSAHSISLPIRLSRPDWRGYDVSSSHAVPTPGQGTVGQQSHSDKPPQNREEVTTGLGSTKNTARGQRNAQRHPELSTPS